jgi:broad specificity phosphatase PhoE
MLRARKTATTILSTQPRLDRLHIDADLHEIRTGWQGEPLSSLELIDWDFYAHPRATDDESLQMVHYRMQRWLARMLRRHAGSEVVGVCTATRS